MTTPRFPLAGPPTPLQLLDRLGAALGFDSGMLWAKRDDLTALAGGGNKARKLEFLLADALAGEHDLLLTGGAVQSNHVAMTAAAARIAGLDCVAVLGGREPDVCEGNLVLDRVLGLEVIWAGHDDTEHVETVMAETAMLLTAEGRHPYEIPLGGASPVGTLGYVVAADEIMAAAPTGATVYTASGTGGTQAGLAVGFGHHHRVRGVDVGAVPDLRMRISDLLAPVATRAERPIPDGHLQVDQQQIGEGYGEPTRPCREAIDMAAHHEGLLLDPVYSGKAMAGLIDDRREGRLPPDQPVVFLHTGGTPVLFTERYRGWLTGPRP